MNIRDKQSNKKVVQCEHEKTAILNDDSCAFVEYEKPMLIAYGDVRDITLGPSPGLGESGSGVFLFRP